MSCLRRGRRKLASLALETTDRDAAIVRSVSDLRLVTAGQLERMHFLVPEHGADRMGREGALYELAQWYPRVNVYDDLRGWNTEPYLGQGEFYLEYGNYTVELTVPSGYIVASTGTLTNPRDVLTSTEIIRWAQAAK